MYDLPDIAGNTRVTITEGDVCGKTQPVIERLDAPAFDGGAQDGAQDGGATARLSQAREGGAESLSTEEDIHE